MPDMNRIGEKIKDMRVERGLTLEDVAESTSISLEILESMEKMELLPPLGHIISLAKVFEVPVGELFGDSGDSPFSIVRSTDRTKVNRFGSADTKTCGYSYEGLGQNKRNRQMEPFLVTLNPNQSHKVEANQHIGEEFIFILEGRVKVSLLEHTDVLEKGDSIYYDSHMPHIVSCYGDEPATILAVIYAKEEMIIL